MSKFSLPPLFAGKQLPPLTKILEHAVFVSVPMKVKFRGVTYRESTLIRGPQGWGEFAPFIEYDAYESSSWLANALEAAWLGYPKAQRHEIPLNATIPAVEANQVARVIEQYSGEIREVKVKVAETGQRLHDDVSRLRVVRELLPQARIKVDANMGWSNSQALRALEAFEEFNLLYVEQPVATVEDLAVVREQARNRGLTTLIAADESVRKAEDPLHVAELGAADVVIVKAAPLGGVRRARDIVAAAGLPAVVSSALETSVGIRTGAALAASLPELPFGCGLGTVSLFEADVVANPLVGIDGKLTIRDVQPGLEQVCALAMSQKREQWWRGRIAETYRVLEQRVN